MSRFAGEIRPFGPGDQEEARSIIQQGLSERWGDSFDPNANPDTDDLHGSYVDGGGRLLVATEGPGNNPLVIGVGALREEGPGIARIARVSVHPDHRRRGVATAIVEDLVALARADGCHTVRASTDRPWTDAVDLYLGCGFVVATIDETDVHLAREFPWTNDEISTERLRLRAPSVLDNDFVATILTDLVVRTYLGGPASVAVVDWIRASSMANEWGSFIVERGEGDGPIGLVQLEDWRGDMEISYQLLPAEWGNGFGLEAVRSVIEWAWANTEADSLIAVVHPDNELSQKLLGKLGFVAEEDFEEYGEPQRRFRLPGSTPASAPDGA